MGLSTRKVKVDRRGKHQWSCFGEARGGVVAVLVNL